MKTRLKNILKRIYRKFQPRKPQETTTAPAKEAAVEVPPVAKEAAPSLKENPPIKENPPKPPSPEIHIEITETPNPNACKYDSPHHIAPQAFSFSSKNPPTDHSLAQKILSFPEVSSIFGVGNFITITKTQESSWENIHPKVEACLKEYILQQE